MVRGKLMDSFNTDFRLIPRYPAKPTLEIQHPDNLAFDTAGVAIRGWLPLGHRSICTDHWHGAIRCD